MPSALKCIFIPALTLVPLVSAQTPATTPATTTPARSQAEPQSPIATLHTAAKLVVVEITVTDKSGNPLHNLKKEDFTVLENGHPQTIGSFEEHVALSAADAVKFPPLPKLPPGVFTNITPAPINSAVNIMLIDSLNTPYDDQSYMRAQLVNYINHAPPGSNTAIFTLTTVLTMLQGFTSDPNILQQAVAKQLSHASPLLDRTQTGEDSSNVVAASAAGPGAAAVAAFQKFASDTSPSAQVVDRKNLTLAAFNVLARYLSNIPGRKNLVWFSGSFPLAQFANNSLDSPSLGSDESAFRQTSVLLAHSQVAVYPVDCRGVQASPTLSGEYQGSTGTHGNPSAFLRDKSSFESNMAAERSTMEDIATNTGGRAFFNENDLAKATAKAVETGSNYYTISYTPSNENWHGEYRKIEVKIPPKGYTLAYRHGYFAVDPNSPHNALPSATAEAGKTPGKTSAPDDNVRLVRAAMVHGAPGSTEILYKVRVLPTGEPQDHVAPGNVLSSFGVRKAADHGDRGNLFDRYVVDFDADATDMLFPPNPNGGYDCKVEFVIEVFQNGDGQLVNTASGALIANLSLAQRNALLRNGFPFREQVSVPIKGDYTLRIAIHDLNSDRIGALEVPVASVKNLPRS